MTTIAYRNGVIAADSGVTTGGSQVATMLKIAKNSRGDVAGACGHAWWCQAFLSWFKDSTDTPPPVSRDDQMSAAMIVTSRRKLRIFESIKGTIDQFDIAAPYYALGSGRCEALGAMFAGATATDAVRAAVALDESTFGRVHALKVGK